MLSVIVLSVVMLNAVAPVNVKNYSFSPQMFQINMLNCVSLISLYSLLEYLCLQPGDYLELSN
jgi:hypothetical protein